MAEHLEIRSFTLPENLAVRLDLLAQVTNRAVDDLLADALQRFLEAEELTTEQIARELQEEPTLGNFDQDVGGPIDVDP